MKNNNNNKINSYNKIVLITGSSTGIGFSCLELFLKRGWSVLAHYYEKTQQLNDIAEKDNGNNIVLKPYLSR